MLGARLEGVLELSDCQVVAMVGCWGNVEVVDVVGVVEEIAKSWVRWDVGGTLGVVKQVQTLREV